MFPKPRNNIKPKCETPAPSTRSRYATPASTRATAEPSNAELEVNALYNEYLQTLLQEKQAADRLARVTATAQEQRKNHAEATQKIKHNIAVLQERLEEVGRLAKQEKELDQVIAEMQKALNEDSK